MKVCPFSEAMNEPSVVQNDSGKFITSLLSLHKMCIIMTHFWSTLQAVTEMCVNRSSLVKPEDMEIIHIFVVPWTIMKKAKLI